MSNDIINIIKGAAEMGAAEAIRKMQPQNDRISKTKAERIYGAAFLRDNADRLTVVPAGNRLEYSLAELEQVRVSRSVAALAMRIESYLIQNQ